MTSLIRTYPKSSRQLLRVPSHLEQKKTDDGVEVLEKRLKEAERKLILLAVTAERGHMHTQRLKYKRMKQRGWT